MPPTQVAVIDAVQHLLEHDGSLAKLRTDLHASVVSALQRKHGDAGIDRGVGSAATQQYLESDTKEGKSGYTAYTLACGVQLNVCC